MEILEKKFCITPFNLLIWDNFGLKPCTWLRNFKTANMPGCYSINDKEDLNSLKEVWTSDLFEKIRQSIKNDTYEFCNFDCCCEAQSDYSSFKTLDELKRDYPLIYDYLTADNSCGPYQGLPETLNVAYDTTCNLACPSCNRSEIPDLSNHSKDIILSMLSQISQNISSIYFAGMGEPLYSPHYKKFIESITPSTYPNLKTISLQTNGTLLDQSLWKTLPLFFREKAYEITVSIDGAQEKTYSTNRPGGNWDNLLGNLNFIKQLKQNREIGKIRLYFVYQQNNFTEIPAAIELANSINADQIFFARIANWNGLPTDYFNQIDVASPRHRQFDEFTKIKQTLAKTNSSTKVIISE